MMANKVMSNKERQQNNKFCLNLVDVSKDSFSKDTLLGYVSYKPYWIEYQIQIERDAIWKRWNDIKTEAQKYYNEKELEDTQKAIEKIICDIDEHAQFLRGQENATGFPIRQLEKYVEEEWMGKHHADLHISSFLEKFFGIKVWTHKNEIDTILKEAKKIQHVARYKGFIPVDWNNICKLADKNNYSCHTCRKYYSYNSNVEYWSDGCYYKKDGSMCKIELVRKFNERISKDLLNISGHDAININQFVESIKRFKQEHQSIKDCWYKINRISPEWRIVPNTKRISIAISIFVVLILLLIIL